MKSTRDGFGDQLIISARDNKDILTLSADLGKATKLDKFAKEFPDRFFEIGIAENNMIGIASGLSEHGYKVFLASFAAFLTGKYDTIRCSIAYSRVPCILVGSHGGLAIGRDGVTQMGLEDISLMRSLPGMVVLNPATYIEAMKITEYLCNTKLDTPHYLRIGRQPIEELFDNNYKFELGKGQIIKEGNKIAVIASGCILPDVKNAVNDLDVMLINMPTIKPIDATFIVTLANFYNDIITIEDHSIIGGLGSAVAEVLAEIRSSCKLTRIGVNDVFPESGKTEDLYEKYGLSVSKIKNKIEKILEYDK